MLADEGNLNGNRLGKRILNCTLHVSLLFFHWCHFAVGAVDGTPRGEYFTLVLVSLLLYFEYLLRCLDLKVMDLSPGRVGRRRFCLLSFGRLSAGGNWGFGWQDVRSLDK